MLWSRLFFDITHQLLSHQKAGHFYLFGQSNPWAIQQYKRSSLAFCHQNSQWRASRLLFHSPSWQFPAARGIWSESAVEVAVQPHQWTSSIQHTACCEACTVEAGHYSDWLWRLAVTPKYWDKLQLSTLGHTSHHLPHHPAYTL